MAIKGRGDSGADRIVQHVQPGVNMSTSIIEAIADLESAPAVDLDVSLYDTVDLDALDTLCEQNPDSFAIEFVCDGFRIQIERDRKLVVERC